MANNELKPCFRPGCKGSPYVHITSVSTYYVRCRLCGICSEPKGIEKQAIADWNLRSGISQETAEEMIHVIESIASEYAVDSEIDDIIAKARAERGEK